MLPCGTPSGVSQKLFLSITRQLTKDYKTSASRLAACAVAQHYEQTLYGFIISI